MSTLEIFRLIAVAAACGGLAALAIPSVAADRARRAGALAIGGGSWVLLAASLIGRDDVDIVVNRPTGTLIGVVVALIVGAIAVILVLRFPTLWLIALGIALPIRVPVTIGSQSANLLIPLYGVIAVGLIAVTIIMRRGQVTPTTPTRWITLPLTAFTILTLVSLGWTSDLTEGTAKITFFYLPFLVLFHLLIVWWEIVDRPFQKLGATTVAMGVGTACVALYQFMTSTIWWNTTLQQGNNYNRFFRVNGIFYDPNILGRFLAMAILISLAYLVYSSDRMQAIVVSAAIVVLAACLIVTFSRSSALMLLIGLVMIGAHVFGVRRVALIATLGVIVVGGLSLATSSSVREKTTSLSGLSKASEGRARLVEGGVDLWKTQPIQGVGIGSFADEYAETLAPRTRRRTRVVISHTAPVTVLAELGVIGAGLLAALIGGTIAGLAGPRPADRQTRLFLVTILALLAGIFAHGVLYSAVFEDPYVWVLLSAGATVAAWTLTRSTDASTAEPNAPATHA